MYLKEKQGFIYTRNWHLGPAFAPSIDLKESDVQN